MRKNNYLLAIAALFLLFNACNDEAAINTRGEETEQCLSLTAAMPVGGPETRIALARDGQDYITLSWETGDQIQLAFVQGNTKIKQTVTVKDISSDGKSASFDVIVPANITAGNFDLYGVYGGGGLDDANPSLAVLPTNAAGATSLADLQNRKDVMLYFAKKGLSTTNPNTGVAFKHLGSLFSITLTSTASTTLTDLKEARLISSESGWAYNNGGGGSKFDLESGTFTNTDAAGDYISFGAPVATVAPGATLSFWGWYPSLPDKTWPTLGLELRNTSDGVIVASSNAKPARTAPTAAGKSFYFFAVYDGSGLQFVDATPLNKSAWTIEATTTWDPSYSVSKMLDGDRSTYWHSALSGYPQGFTVDMKSIKKLSGIYLTNRQDIDQKATPKVMNVDVSVDGANWTTVYTTTAFPDSRLRTTVPFETPVYARYFKVTVYSTYDTAATYTYMAEVGAFTPTETEVPLITLKAPANGTIINLSEITDVTFEWNTDGVEIEGGFKILFGKNPTLSDAIVMEVSGYSQTITKAQIEALKGADEPATIYWQVKAAGGENVAKNSAIQSGTVLNSLDSGIPLTLNEATKNSLTFTTNADGSVTLTRTGADANIQTSQLGKALDPAKTHYITFEYKSNKAATTAEFFFCVAGGPQGGRSTGENVSVPQASDWATFKYSISALSSTQTSGWGLNNSGGKDPAEHFLRYDIIGDGEGEGYEITIRNFKIISE